MADVAVTAAERIGGTLARQAASVEGGLGTRMFDQGIIPAFGPGAAGEFQTMVNGNVILSGIGGLRRGNRRRRRAELVYSNTPARGLLDSIQSVRDQFMELQRYIEEWHIHGANVSMNELMRVQFYVQQLAYLNELSSKVADKTSQGAQTLFRNQG
jgi:hypothetical protein